jgi:hypothetical protein
MIGSKALASSTAFRDLDRVLASHLRRIIHIPVRCLIAHSTKHRQWAKRPWVPITKPRDATRPYTVHAMALRISHSPLSNRTQRDIPADC